MGKRQIFTIGGITFRTLESVKQEIRSRIASYEDKEPFSPEDWWFFRDLLDLHPHTEVKIGCGVRGFYAQWNPVYKNTRTLYLVRQDGSVTDWSWTECLKPSSHEKKIKMAFRALLEPGMIIFKKKFFDSQPYVATPCPITGQLMTFASAHVDHIPPQTFEALFRDFIATNKVDITTLTISSDGKDNTYRVTISDEVLANRWLDYHSQHAHLRVISSHANLSNVKKIS